DMHARLLVHPRLGGDRSFSSGEATGSKQAGSTVAEPEMQMAAARSRAGGRRIPQILKYISVAVGTLAASVLVQAFFLPPRSPGGDRRVPLVEAERPLPCYVATLVQTADCVWEDRSAGLRTGARVQLGELRVLKGLARLHFDCGSDLVVEGPAVLRVD